MSSAAKAIRVPIAKGRIHLPSVHVRTQADPTTGFDYEEDIYVRGHGRDRAARRMVALVVIERGEIALIRQTTDVLSADELFTLDEELPFLMDADNPELIEMMETRGRAEFARQRRITLGEEQACASCGCSESRACSGGCVRATRALCSRCL
jgi:hypothetical protein